MMLIIVIVVRITRYNAQYLLSIRRSLKIGNYNDIQWTFVRILKSYQKNKKKKKQLRLKCLKLINYSNLDSALWPSELIEDINILCVFIFFSFGMLRTLLILESSNFQGEQFNKEFIDHTSVFTKQNLIVTMSQCLRWSMPRLKSIIFFFFLKNRYSDIDNNTY